jgi:phospholipid/cholesterol/gamma-HCH transport system permease protein
MLPSIIRASGTPSGTATIAVEGNLAIPDAKAFYDRLRATMRRRDVKRVVIDLQHVARIDGAGMAVVSLGRKLAARTNKAFELANVDARHRKVFELAAQSGPAANEVVELPPTISSRLGVQVLGLGAGLVAFVGLLADTFGQLGYVIIGKKKLPKGATTNFIVVMGVDALPIVSLLSALLGATLAFQGVVLLQRFGAGMYVADITGLSMIREFAPLITAIVLTGRNGAAIAAELGTMRVRGELDALAAMGVSSSRFLLLPRLLALSFVQPALTLIGIFVGIAGAMLVAALVLDLPAWVFWSRIVARVSLMDFIHGLTKSFIFAQIIGFTGSFLGMRATNDPSSVGAATTRTVVIGIFLIVLVDAIAATLGTLGGM